MSVIIDGSLGITSPLYKAPNCIFENSQTISTSYTISANTNALSAGPITIDTGVDIVVPTGSYWAIV
jgi:hypothetical protein